MSTDELCFVAHLPLAVLCEIVNYTPFVSWAQFVMTCKAHQELFLSPQVAGQLYRQINLESAHSAIRHALVRVDDIDTALGGLTKYIEHAHQLKLARIKGFNDYALRFLVTHAPKVSSLSLFSLTDIKGAVGAHPNEYVQPTANDADQAATQATNAANPAAALVDSIPAVQAIAQAAVRPKTALELWVTQLDSLVLSTVPVRDGNMHALAPLMKNLRMLDLSSSVMQNALPAIGEHAQNLEHIFLDGSWRLRAVHLEQFAEKCSLKLKSFSGKSLDGLTDKAVTSLVSRCGHSLEKLVIKFNRFVTHVAIDAVAKYCTKLEHLALSMVGVPNAHSAVWMTLFSSPKQFTYLDLSANDTVNDDVINAVTNTCARVENLNLRATAVTSASAELISSRLSNLRYLDMSSCNNVTTFAGIHQLKNLGRLSFPDCPALDFTSFDIYKQMAMMSSSLSFLYKYDLSRTNLDDKGLALLLEKAYWMSHLSVYGCKALTDVSVGSIIQLLDHPLYTAPHFSLGICSTPVTDEALRKLKLKYARRALLTCELHVTKYPLSEDSEGSSSTQLLEQALKDVPEDRLSINCKKGGATRIHDLCQCNYAP